MAVAGFVTSGRSSIGKTGRGFADRDAARHHFNLFAFFCRWKKWKTTLHFPAYPPEPKRFSPSIAGGVKRQEVTAAPRPKMQSQTPPIGPKSSGPI